MTKHSSIVGGSTAARVLACPGSVTAILALPPSIAISSEYAEEGTFYHDVMAKLLAARQATANEDLQKLVDKWKGQTFYDRQLTQHHIDEGITPALAALAELETGYGGDFRVMAVEHRIKFPDLPGVFGTIDLIMRNDRTVLHVDFKFGQGVPVYATYDIGDEQKVNDQLMFYLVAAKHSLRRLVYQKADTLVAAIIQPRLEGNQLSHTIVEAWELSAFKDKLMATIIEALTPQAKRVKGEWCRWAPCKTTCPHWTGPLLDAALFKVERVGQVTVDDYGAHLAKAKALVDMVAVLKTEVDTQMHAYLASGGTVPGWRLKLKKKMRQWIDEKIVDRDLRKLGMTPGEIWRKKLLTFEAADAWAKRKKKAIPEHLRVAPPTSETTIAQDDDPAPRVEPVVVIEQFQASLRQLLGPEKTALIDRIRSTENR